MITKNPLPIPLEKLGVKDGQFTHQSKLHGAAHVNRVIVNILNIAQSMGFSRLLPECWAAAYLHDLARRHDGPCEKHGEWAVRERLPSLREFFEKGGVKNFGAVENAVVFHCKPDGFTQNPYTSESDTMIVTALLKDADALDRWRLGDLDPRQLRIPRSHIQMFMPMTERLFTQTTNCSADWIRTWEIGVEVFNPHRGMADTIKDYWDENETGQQRRARRIEQSKFYEDVVSFVDSVPGPLTEMVKAKPLPMRLFTYTATEGWNKFCKDGRWLSFWEMQDAGIKTWHEMYGENPADGRAYNDLRLWGEKGRYVCCGIMVPAEMPDYDRSEQHMWASRSYGPVRIEWRTEALSCATFTLNDSHENAFAIPWSPENLIHAVKKKGGFNFIEFQIHKPMTAADIKETTQ